MVTESIKTLNLSLILMTIFVVLVSCSKTNFDLTVTSPDSEIAVDVLLKDGRAFYTVKKNDILLLDKSALDFEILNPEMTFSRFIITATERNKCDETWETAWGENKKIRNNYNELIVRMQSVENADYGMTVFFRVFDDGIGFRYDIIGKEGDSVQVVEENTEFNLTGNYTCWWIPQDFDSYERTYQKTDFKDIKAVNTPVTMKSKENGIHLSIHEAALTDYAGMTLEKTEKGLKSVLVPWPDGIKVKSTYPLRTPWRTIQIAENAGELIESNLILNLNEPSKIENTSWITTGKYIGIWWGMHMNIYTWHAGPNHGATTTRAKAYIDFGAKHDISGLLIEGWNEGWEGFGAQVTAQNYTKPYPDIDYEEVARYGREKGVPVIGHHETAANVTNYIAQMEDAFDYYERLGVPAIKTGYVGDIIPKGQHHHGQWMVNHYRDVVKIAAEHKIMIDAHEPIKSTGISRTWPNMMTREGAKGMEYNAWSDGLAPEHTVILPFTRLLGGPMDFTPGIFDITFDKYKKGYRVYTTLAKQLSYYVNIYSPWQMAADLIENYEGHPAFEFIDAVETDWDESHVLAAEVGDYLIMARRQGADWFLGATTDEYSRDFEIDLKFLEDNKKYVAHIFTDALNTDWKNAPTEIEIRKYIVTNQDIIHTVLSPSGGQAVHFYEYKAGNYPVIAEFNATAAKRIGNYQKVPIYGQKTKVDHKALGKQLETNPRPETDYGNQSALNDGIRGSIMVSDNWVGFKNDTEIIIDLDEPANISSVLVGTMQKLDSWIFPAKRFEIFISENGDEYFKVAEQQPELDRNIYSVVVNDFEMNFEPRHARYIKIIARSFGEIPGWHSGKGNPAWMFIDELIVN